MIYAIFESLLEAIDKILSEGRISWGAIITALLFFNKIQRNKEFRLRDQRVERNQQRIMAKLGVEGEWASDSRQSGLKFIYRKLSYYLLMVFKHPKRSKIMEKLKSRKFWMTIAAALIPLINEEFGLQLDISTVGLMMTAIMAGVGFLAHVDAKKILAGLIHPKLKPIEIGVSYTSFKDAIPYLKTIHDGINELLEDVKKDDGSQAFKDALQTYSAIKSIIEANKHPEPVVSIVDEQGAA